MSVYPISAKFRKLFRDFVDRSRDQGFCRNAAIALAQSML